MLKEEIKKAIVAHYLEYLDSRKSLLESNSEVEEAYLNGQEKEIDEAFDEVISEIKTQYNITE